MANFENGIKVGIKIRPLNSKESVNEYTSTYHLIPEIHSLVYSPNQCQNKQIFQSDYLFDENEPIEGIYHLICHTMIERVIDGYEGALFACKYLLCLCFDLFSSVLTCSDRNQTE